MFIDYKGKYIKSLAINGAQVDLKQPNLWSNHRIYVPPANQKVGENVAEIEFESFYVNDCQGMQYFKDDQDSSEYMYSELEPDYSHIIFPCFDQPNLKATHESWILGSSDWEVISNAQRVAKTQPLSLLEKNLSDDRKAINAAMEQLSVGQDSSILRDFKNEQIQMH